MGIAVRIPDEKPDYMARSVLTIAPGLWRMRNGHTAEIKRRQDIPYKSDGKGPTKIYVVWHGICVECATPMSWNVNGCYAAVGRHRNDIVGPA